MRIDAGRFQIRPWRGGDEGSLVRHANSREVWRNLTDRFPHPYTLEDAERWIRLQPELAGRNVNGAIAIEGSAVGGIGFELGQDVACRSAEIGYWLGEAYWGRGIATEALRLSTAYAFRAFPLERLQAKVFEWNVASCRVLEKAGYALESRQRRSVFKDGQLIDCFLYVRLRADGP